jgi:DnaJ-domain-containing protein 1
MGDIFKRLYNLARSEVTHLRSPDLKLTEEFKEYLKRRPDFDQYRRFFEQGPDHEEAQDWEDRLHGRQRQSSGQSSGSSSGQQQRSSGNSWAGLGYDPYQVLEVSPSAPFEEIEKAYKKMARKYHPDRYQNADERETATRLMAMVNASFAFIKEKHGKK